MTKEKIIVAISYALIGIILMPKFNEFFRRKFNFALPIIVKIIIIVILAVIIDMNLILNL